MRKVIASTYMTLDGRIDDLPEWTLPYDSDEVVEFHDDVLANCDGLILGRTTYDIFAVIWPARAGRLAYGDKINKLPKYVATGTLTHLEWENSYLIEGDVAAAVTELKQQPGQDLVVYGGHALTRTLMSHDLIDEYRILLHPVLLGKGRSFFAEAGPRVDLELVDNTVIAQGVTVLTYRPVREV